MRLVSAIDLRQSNAKVRMLAVWRGKYYQPFPVKLAVGKRDEPLVLGAIVPAELPDGLKCTNCEVQNRGLCHHILKIVLSLGLVRVHTLEKAGGRQLHGIAHDHYL